MEMKVKKSWGSNTYTRQHRLKKKKGHNERQRRAQQFYFQVFI